MKHPLPARHALSLAASLALAAAGTQAQTSPAEPPAPPAAPAPAPAPAPAAPAAAAKPAAAAPSATPSAAPARPAAAGNTQRVEITGGRTADVDERRQSTAAKIVIGREEIDKFGDASVGEVLRRLPGVTTPGAPGRGGPPRMRGLGGGFTQLLIDGQRVPPGFSIESLTPEQIERIEILRAPTAETGAQAIAGTINIITREGFKRRLNDLRVGGSYENGKFTPGLNWTHNNSAGNLTYNVSGSLFFPRRESDSSTRTTVRNIASDTLVEDRTVQTHSEDKRYGVNLTSRLQWRLGGSGDFIAVQPILFHSDGSNRSQSVMTQTLSRPSSVGLFSSALSESDNRFTNARLQLQYRQQMGAARLEVNGGGGGFRATSNSLVRQQTAGGPRTLDDRSQTREDSVNLVVKASGSVGGSGSGQGEHQLVAGAEVDASERSETRRLLQNGSALLSDFNGNLQARSLRTAAYVQDEWSINPRWAVQGGLRWEGIRVRGDAGTSGGVAPENTSSVWTPLAHLVWKPDPKKRDQIRLSLTRSYRPPALANLIARPNINRDYDATTTSNTFTSPDTAGNPNLKPELATGIDLAFERYLEGGGVLSANLFHREISNLMRGVTTLETVSWSAFPRWVRRMQNIGDATTSGLELDGKFRLDQLITGAPGVELRANVSFFDSKVKGIPGPNNRLDQQAKATGNFGADYRFRGTPFTAGGNVNWVPGYTTRTDVGQTVTVSTKRQWDAYVLYTVSPTLAVRGLVNNAIARDFATTTTAESLGVSGAERSTVQAVGPTYVNWQLRLEMKL